MRVSGTFFTGLVLGAVLAFSSCGTCPVQGPADCGSGRVWVPVPLCRQMDLNSCGVAAVQSVMHYWNAGQDGNGPRQATLAGECGTTENGTDYRAMLAYARKQGFVAESRTNMTVEGLTESVRAGVPVIVAFQAWSDNPTVECYSTNWSEGHYAVVMGYDDRNLYFMDPSTLGNYTFIPREEFLARWHDETAAEPVERLVRFGLILRKEQPTYQPCNVLKLE